jgi:hypothetical protein
LRAAVRRRDELEASLPPATCLRRTDARSRTGVVGVCLVVRRRACGEFRYWCANWVELDGRRVARVFAEAKYGAGRARELAERTRREAVDRILSQRGVRSWWQRGDAAGG